MWDKAGKTQDTKAVIPDSSYAGIYQATIDFCKAHGAFDPKNHGKRAQCWFDGPKSRRIRFT